MSIYSQARQAHRPSSPIHRRWLVRCSLVLVWLGALGGLRAQDPWYQMRLPTLGGKQFWTDYLVYGEYRIQQNAITGAYRLLDPRNTRLTGGSFAACESEFRRLQLAGKVPELTETVVLTIHGLGRSRSSMKNLAKKVHEETKWTVMNMEYASTRKPIDEHARALDSVIKHIDAQRIHLVGHSLGNIVVRRYLKVHTNERTGQQGDPRLGRLVMLGPPNQGAAMARLFKKVKPFEWIAGHPGLELANDPEAFQKELAIPKLEFGIIAGSAFSSRGGNPLIPGPDDLVVGVEETKLDGSRDFLVVPYTHTWLMDREPVQTAVANFLRYGRFAKPQ